MLDDLAKHYEIVIFTASLPKYANPLLDELDPNGSIDYRLFRQHCTRYRNSYVKDMSKLGRELKNVIIIDNSPMSFFYHPENAILSKSWFEDKTDRDLFKLIELLIEIKDDHDVRTSIKRMNHPELLLTERILENKRIEAEESKKHGDDKGTFNSPTAAIGAAKHFTFAENSSREKSQESEEAHPVKME
jgi:hypothetical protein